MAKFGGCLENTMSCDMHESEVLASNIKITSFEATDSSIYDKNLILIIIRPGWK